MLLQVSVQNNNLEAVQVNPEKHICPEDSAQVICSEVSAQVICSEVSAQVICSEVSAQAIHSEDSAQAICSEDSAHAICSEVSAQAIHSEDSAQAICSEDSAHAICSEDSAHAICSEDSAKVLDKVPCYGNLNTKTDMNSKKHVAYSTARLLFASKQPLLSALKQHKKRKNNERAKRRSIDNEIIPDDQQTSTSETALTKDISCKSHRRRKRSHASSSSDSGDKLDSKKPHLAEHSSSSADRPLDKKDDKDAAVAITDLPRLCVSSVADQNDSRNSAHPNEGVSRHFDILTRGLSEINGKQP
jgi:ubiquitin carboxyl-terminal hydrolase 36/42